MKDEMRLRRKLRDRCLFFLLWLMGFFVLLGCGVPVRAQNIQWIRQFGTGGPDQARGVAVGGPGLYVVGLEAGEDAFVRRYDASGNVIWARPFGTAGFDEAYGVAVDSANVYIVGETTGAGGQDAFVRRYDPNGNLLWAQPLGSSGTERAFGVAVGDIGIYVVGSTDGVLPQQSSAGGQDAFLSKYSASGSELWTVQFGTADQDLATAVALDASGVYVVGTAFGTLPGQTNAGGPSDAFVRKYDTNGNEQWTRQFGTGGADRSFGVAVDGSGVYVVGQTGSALPGQASAGLSDAFVRKYSATGNELWTRQFGTASSDVANAAAVDGTGVFVAGSVLGALPGQGSAGGQSDAFVRKYDPNGTEQWTRQFGSSNLDWANAVAVGSGVYVAGFTDGDLPEHISAGGDDAFLLRLSLTSACTYSVAPVTSQFFAASGGSSQVSVTAPNGCAWAAVSNANWVTITSGNSGSGSGIVVYAVAENTGAASRIGTLTIAGQTFTVTQASEVPPAGPTISDGGVVNNASFAPAPAAVAPGSIAAVFGANLNDGSAVLSSRFGPDGNLVTSLGGASVWINNIPAPMFYSTPEQLGIQIPFELAGQTSAAVQVTAGGQTSAPRTFFLDAAAPGIFTWTQDGRGAAAALHQDGVTPVTAQSPARPGETVVLFATGLAAVTPPLATGSPATGNRTVSSAAVSIDGIPGDVQFSGAAPSFVGLNQINVRIPLSTRSAPDIAVVLSITGKQSNLVTIPVAP